MDQATRMSGETLEQAGERFPDLDDAAVRRAAARAQAGADAGTALAQEWVMLHLVRAYN